MVSYALIKIIKKKKKKKKKKKRLSVNYFVNLGAECYFSKIGCTEFSFPKKRKCKCNLLKKINK